MFQRVQHVGVYGLIVSEGQVLLVEKSRGPYIGKWDLPGGKIEFGESPDTTLIREILEETGLEIESYSFFKSDAVVVNYEDPELGKLTLHHVGLIYKVKVKSGKPIAPKEDDEDVISARWCDLVEMDHDDFTPFVQELLLEHPDTIQ